MNMRKSMKISAAKVVTFEKSNNSFLKPSAF